MFHGFYSELKSILLKIKNKKIKNSAKATIFVCV